MTLYDHSFKSQEGNPSVDPFEYSQLNPSHIVTPIAPMHTLILNKFYTINEHSLLITNHFSRQENILTHEDIEAWFFCILSIKAIGFYNSDNVAGASQQHKHMQMVPLSEIRRLSLSSTYTIPIDMSIRDKIIRKEWKFFLPFSTTNGRINGNYGVDQDVDGVSFPNELNGASQDNIYQIPQYQFKHSVIALISSDDWSDVSDKITYAEYLVASYRQMLWNLQLISSISSQASVAKGSYNLLLTERWMMIVCRERESFQTGNIIICLYLLLFHHLLSPPSCY